MQHTQFTVWCDAPSCSAMYRSEWDIPRAEVRKLLAKRGWTVNVGDGPIVTRGDFCPDHKPEATP
jgi:hypothetical protein